MGVKFTNCCHPPKCDEQHLICLFNLSPEPIHHDLSDYPECVAADESDFSNRQYDNTVEIPAYGVFFGNCLENSNLDRDLVS